MVNLGLGVLFQILHVRHSANFADLLSFDQYIAEVRGSSSRVEDVDIGEQDFRVRLCPDYVVILWLKGFVEGDRVDVSDVSWLARVRVPRSACLAEGRKRVIHS